MHVLGEKARAACMRADGRPHTAGGDGEQPGDEVDRRCGNVDTRRRHGDKARRVRDEVGPGAGADVGVALVQEAKEVRRRVLGGVQEVLKLGVACARSTNRVARFETRLSLCVEGVGAEDTGDSVHSGMPVSKALNILRSICWAVRQAKRGHMYAARGSRPQRYVWKQASVQETVQAWHSIMQTATARPQLRMAACCRRRFLLKRWVPLLTAPACMLWGAAQARLAHRG